MQLAAVFTDHMVLQQGAPIRIFGTGQGIITVLFRGQRVQTVANGGAWRAELAPEAAGGPDTLIVTEGEQQTILQDIYVGEVWIAGGQSNMQMRLEETEDYLRHASDCALFRYYHVAHRLSGEDQDPNDGPWKVCAERDCPSYSAIAYYFARGLQARLGCAVGILDCNQGASRAEAWTDPSLLRNRGLVQPDETKHGDAFIYPFNHPGDLYRDMLLPLAPYSVRGVIWYLGESDRGLLEGHLYCQKFLTMVESWRSLWAPLPLPFLTVQLSSYGQDGIQDESWPCLREQQLRASREGEDIAMVMSADLGDYGNIHPLRKRQVAERLVLAARNRVYGEEEVIYSGPLYRGMRIDGAKCYLSFEHGEGLYLDGPARSCFLCGEDGVYVPAQACVEADALCVWSDQVEHPVAVKMGFENYSSINLYNGAGLVACPFRTDEGDAPRKAAVQ